LFNIGGISIRKVVIIFVFLIALTGCNQENTKVDTPSNIQENVTVKQKETNPDYQNVFIYEIKETSVVIAPPATDPEASYPVYEIFIDEKTRIEGRKDNFDELTIGDDVKVWVKRKSEDKEVAEKVVVNQ
jgi:carbonic anhydrase/acetyltransferase-like protein (isoleucine patch superfamily)